MLRGIACGLMSFMLCAAADSAPPAPAPVAARLSLQDKKEIVAAVVHAIWPPARSTEKPEFTLTLTIEGGGDTAQLRAHAMSTYPASQRFIGNERRRANDHGCMVDRDSGLPAFGIGLGEIRPIDAATVEVKAGSAVCVMGITSSTYTLRKLQGRWRIVGEHMNYIV